MDASPDTNTCSHRGGGEGGNCYRPGKAPLRMVAAVIVPSLAVVPVTWMVSPTFRADNVPGFTTLTVVAEVVVTVTVVPAGVVTVNEPLLTDFTSPVVGASPLPRLPTTGGAFAPAPGRGPPNPPGPPAPPGPSARAVAPLSAIEVAATVASDVVPVTRTLSPTFTSVSAPVELMLTVVDAEVTTFTVVPVPVVILIVEPSMLAMVPPLPRPPNPPGPPRPPSPGPWPAAARSWVPVRARLAPTTAAKPITAAP